MLSTHYYPNVTPGGDEPLFLSVEDEDSQGDENTSQAIQAPIDTVQTSPEGLGSSSDICNRNTAQNQNPPGTDDPSNE
ncbi:hypothetical protein BGZ76_000689, partial [Entomortierella beljakovae]